MFSHTVLWRWQPAATAEQIDQALDELDALDGAVAGVHEIRSRSNLAAGRPAARGYTHCTTSTIEDDRAMQAWLRYPPHLAWGARYVTAEHPLVASLISLDLDECGLSVAQPVSANRA